MQKIFTGIFILLICSSVSIAQTKFKERVYITVNDESLSDSLVKFLGQKEFYRTNGYKVMVLETKSKVENLVFKPGDRHIAETTKTVNGITHTIKTDSIISKADTIVLEKKEKFTKLADIKEGKYPANLHASNDTLYINFWLDKSNDRTYYDENVPEDSVFSFLPNKTYFITLRNRESVSFWGGNWVLSAVTVPFKMNFGKQGDPTILTTGINVSTFVGYRFSKHSYSYDMYKKMNKNEFSFSLGPILGLSSQEIDSASTSGQVLVKNNTPLLTAGFGGVINIKDFSIGVFGGKELGIGKEARTWNYHNRWWVGVGFGYKLALFNKPE